VQLPINCEAQYIENILSIAESSEIFDWICNHTNILSGENFAMADGGLFHLSVGKCMFVDEALNSAQLFPFVHGRRQTWPAILLPLKQKVEQLTGVSFSVCVAIYYQDGTDNVGFHSDLPAFGPTNVIASLSLGQAREFIFRDKQDHSKQHSLLLADGSLVIMGEGCQDNYEHALPALHTHKSPRINLTFRQFNCA